MDDATKEITVEISLVMMINYVFPQRMIDLKRLSAFTTLIVMNVLHMPLQTADNFDAIIT